jgi:hypothetical protein
MTESTQRATVRERNPVAALTALLSGMAEREEDSAGVRGLDSPPSSV